MILRISFILGWATPPPTPAPTPHPNFQKTMLRAWIYKWFLRTPKNFFLSFYRPKIFFISKKYIVYQMIKPVSLSLSSSQTTVRSPDISFQTKWQVHILAMIRVDPRYNDRHLQRQSISITSMPLCLWRFEPSEERRRYKLCLTFFAWQYTIHNEIAINEHAACRRTYKHPRTTFLGQRSKRHVSGTWHFILFRWINY